ncbi:MAG TPA: hypothetical protein VGL11_06105 [Candidatus Binatia bacterium]|jgi:hypothetical protein
MRSVKNLVAALGFICFSSLALLPVSMTVCGPLTSRLPHHAKKIRHVVPHPATAFAAVQPEGNVFTRDVIPTEGDPARNLFEHTAVARNGAALEPDGPQIHLAQGFIHRAKVSAFVFQPVLNL